MRKAVVVLSGGQDSTTCLAYAMKTYDEVAAITFDYGQRHRREIEAAKTVAMLLGAGTRHEIVVLGDILKGSSPLVNKGAQLEQYKDWKSLPGGLEKTFVPMRNQLFLTVAANRAAVWDADLVTGVCQEDFGGYPDCRRSFIDLLEKTIIAGQGGDEHEDSFTFFKIDTPLMDMTKAQSVELALSLPGCYGALGFSHTAYDGAYPPLGHDHATLLRAKGFEQAGVPDPLVVRAYWEGLMPLPESSNYMEFKARINQLRPDFYKGLPGLQATGGLGPHNPDYIRGVAAALDEVVRNAV